MEDSSDPNSEAIKQELASLTYKLNQLSRMIEAKKILLSGLQITEGFYESIDAITQDIRFYL